MYFFTHPNEDISFFGYMIFNAYLIAATIEFQSYCPLAFVGGRCREQLSGHIKFFLLVSSTLYSSKSKGEIICSNYF